MRVIYRKYTEKIKNMKIKNNFTNVITSILVLYYINAYCYML